ncbi:hypothetical protein JL09_g3565 [Pichia kudriavzevii]|uniref:mRNA export factor MEX67 n=1 Tax=Pichia kudriavzevii TaxID=4909 RepID=A0A099NZC0_PICKU|nr:hypothetical protein JL09_g3565 [Pichia kudriavzevii]
MHRGRGGYRGGRGGYSNANSNMQRANEYANQNMISVEIQGWNNAPPQDVVNFLSRKVRIGVQNATPDATGRILVGQVRTMKEANELVKCSGMKFAGGTLLIRIADDLGVANNSSNPTSRVNTIELLKGFLMSRYDPSIKMLNLQSVNQDQTLVSNGLFSNANTSSKFFPALMKVAEKEKLEVESVNLSGNNIDDHSRWLHELSLSFPNIKNIALPNNNIKRIDFFDKLKNKFNMLRELIIVGNPLAQDMGAIQKLISFFPRLVMIDGNQVRDESKLEKILSFPIRSVNMFFENGDLSKIATNFLASYFNFWDSNRMELMPLYSPQSKFSYQCDSSVITDFSANSSTDLWNNYTPHSRNLKKISNEKTRNSRVSIGPEMILQAFSCLPKSKHSLTSDPDSYAIETVSFPSLNGMMITIHGDFEEVAQADQQFPESNSQSNNRGYGKNRYGNRNNYSSRKGILEKRGFDRVFVVVPGPSGNFIVASDMLCVKQYSDKKPWMAGKSTLNPISLPTTQTNIPAPVVNNGSVNTCISVPLPGSPSMQLPPDVESRLNPLQKELVIKVQQETRLKLEFVLMLCEQSNWDYNTAGQNFVNSKGQIPPDAYL